MGRTCRTVNMCQHPSESARRETLIHIHHHRQFQPWVLSAIRNQKQFQDNLANRPLLVSALPADPARQLQPNNYNANNSRSSSRNRSTNINAQSQLSRFDEPDASDGRLSRRIHIGSYVGMASTLKNVPLELLLLLPPFLLINLLSIFHLLMFLVHPKDCRNMARDKDKDRSRCMWFTTSHPAFNLASN
jgi:hypothetical protein